MELTIEVRQEITSENCNAINLSSDILQKLIHDQRHDFKDILCVELRTPYHETVRSHFCWVKEFTASPGTVQISQYVADTLKVSTGGFICGKESILPPKPDMIKIRASNETFGDVEDIKSQFEKLLCGIKIIKKGMKLTVNGKNTKEETCFIEELLDENGFELDVATVNFGDVKVDFLQTKESQTKEKEEEALQNELKSQIVLGTAIGGSVLISKEEKLAKIMNLLKK